MADGIANHGESFAPFLAAIAHYKAVFGEPNIKPVSLVQYECITVQLGVAASTQVNMLLLLLCRSFG
jgi:hypothetical protein